MGSPSVRRRPCQQTGERLSGFLSEDPLSCGKNGSNEKNAVRADTLAKVIFKNSNYKELLSLTDFRFGLEANLELPGESIVGERIGGEDTTRLLLPPGLLE